MKKSKEQKAQEKLAKLLGMEAPTPQSAHASHEVSMEGEAVLAYHENPRSFSHKNCKSCGDEFATRGSPVAYCSDSCRIQAFEERMGVSWKPNRSIQERYGYLSEPLTVSPQGLAVAQAVMAEEAARLEAATEHAPVETSSELDADTLDILADLGLD